MKNKLINKIALGTAQFGLDYGIANKTGRITCDDVYEILDYAFDHGIDTVDTAYEYGESENILGDFFQARKMSFELITKLPHLKEFNDTIVQKLFKDSLRKLKLNQIQGYLVHRFKDFLEYPDVWFTLENLKQQGLIKKIGFSLYRPEELDLLFERQIQFDIVQFPYSIFDRRFERYLKILNEKNVEIHVRSVFLQGSVFLPIEQLPPSFEYNKAHFKRLQEIVSRESLSIGSCCLNFVLLNPLINKVVIGVDSLKQLQANVQAVDSIEEVRRINSELSQLTIEDKNVLVPSRWTDDMKVFVIIQARMGSTRLPGKVLMRILDKTILEYVVERVQRAWNISGVVIATTNDKKDDPIVEVAKNLGVFVYRGSEYDVLDRYYQAAKVYKIEHVVRITADCPLIDPRIIDHIIDYYIAVRPDYCSNVHTRTFPNGLDVEVFSFKALEKVWQRAFLDSDREHVTRYIRNQGTEFRAVNVEGKKDHSDKRWTLDNPKDFEFIKTVIEGLYPTNSKFLTDDILEFLKKNPEVEDINREGILKTYDGQ